MKSTKNLINNYNKKMIDLSPQAKKCFVSFLDLMGVNNLIETLGTERVAERVAEFLFHSVLRLELPSNLRIWEKAIISAVSIKHFKYIHPEYLLYDKKPNYIMLSDSLVFYSQNDDVLDFLSLVYITYQILGILFSSDILVRGSIAYGELCVQSDINFIVGDVLLKAYKLERKQNWFGVALHRSCLEWVGAENEDIFCIKLLKSLKRNPILMNYVEMYLPCWITKWNVPYKDEKKDFSEGTKLALNWPSSFNIMPLCCFKSPRDYIHSEMGTERKEKALEDIKEKLENTKIFIQTNFNFCYEGRLKDL